MVPLVRRLIYYRISARFENDGEVKRLRLPAIFRNVRDRGRIKDVRIRIAPDPPGKLPAFGLYYLPDDRRPIRVADSICVGEVRPGDTVYAASHENRFEQLISLDPPLDAGQFRLFPLDDLDGGWQLIDINNSTD